MVRHWGVGAVLVFSIIIHVEPTQAASEARLTGFASLNGRCERLLVPKGIGPSKRCAGKLLNTSYSNGRSGFYFVTDSGLTVTFTGLGHDQVKLGKDRATQPIDGVIVTSKGKTTQFKAVGECKFSNPNNGPAPVNCRATTERGNFEARFMSDGRPPEVRQF